MRNYLWLLLFVIQFVLPTFACKCDHSYLDPLLKEPKTAKIAFTAEVSRIEMDKFNSHIVVLKVLKAWSGIKDATVTLNDPVASSCGIGFNEGERVLILAQELSPGMIVNMCRLISLPLEKASKIIGRLE